MQPRWSPFLALGCIDERTDQDVTKSSDLEVGGGGGGLNIDYYITSLSFGCDSDATGLFERTCS